MHLPLEEYVAVTVAVRPSVEEALYQQPRHLET